MGPSQKFFGVAEYLPKGYLHGKNEQNWRKKIFLVVAIHFDFQWNAPNRLSIEEEEEEEEEEEAEEA